MAVVANPAQTPVARRMVPRSIRQAVVCAALLLSSQAIFAYRREYRVTWEGRRKPGSEVCFFRGLSGVDPFSLFFSSGNVTCLPADQVLDFPPGLFHAFARHAEGFISGHRDYFIYDDPPRPEAGYEMLEIPLERASYVDVSSILPSLKAGQSVGIWIAPSPTTIGTFLPLVSGEATIMVPASSLFVPLLIEDRRPVAVGETLMLDPGERHVLAELVPNSSTDVIAWTKIDSTAAKELEREFSGNLVEPPEITPVTKTARFKPLFALYNAVAASNTLLFFKNVPPGEAQLQVRGKNWLSQDAVLQVAPFKVTVEPEPLALMPGASLTVAWDSAPLSSTAHPSCATKYSRRSRLSFTVSRCTKRDEDNERSCTVIATRRPFFEPAGSLTFEGLPSGDYEISVDPPGARRLRFAATLLLTRESRLSIPLATFNFFGTVKENGKPLQARIVFETGDAQSDELGMYWAALAADPLTNLIRIVTCEEGRTLTHIPKERVIPNAVYDIDLKHTALHVTVVNNQHQPVAAAQVHFASVKEVGAQGPVLFNNDPSLAQRTDAAGQVTLSGAPVEYPVVICAAHEKYVAKCSEPLSPKQFIAKDVFLQLDAFAFRGKVLGHDGVGLMALVDPFGHVTEKVRLATDGTFNFKNTPQHVHHLVYASDRRPLFALRIPNEWRSSNEIAITPPAVPSRSFSVSAPDLQVDSAFVGVWIGDLYVPLEVLVYHQNSRGHDVEITKTVRLVFQELTETGPIMIAIAGLSPTYSVFVDPFTLPENLNVLRHSVTGAHVIIKP